MSYAPYLKYKCKKCNWETKFIIMPDYKIYNYCPKCKNKNIETIIKMKFATMHPIEG